MRTYTPSPFAPRDKEQRQIALIEAANAVFAERGFDAATTREIAERAGCAEGLIHRYFAGKRGLLLAILDYKTLATGNDFASELPLRDSVQEEIEQVLLHDIDSKWEKRDFMRVCVSQAAIDPELGEAVRERVQSRIVDAIAARLRAHQDAGRIRPEVDTDALASAISGLGFASGFMARIAFGDSHDKVAATAREAAAAIARGISTQQQTGGQE
jgi:AcrR family transcriptional regulator